METWYTKNRTRILLNKRTKYHADPELRKKKQTDALARYYRLKGGDHLHPQNGCFLPPTFLLPLDNESPSPSKV